MSTLNIHFHYKIGTFPEISLNIYFLELSEEFTMDSKSHRCSKH